MIAWVLMPLGSCSIWFTTRSSARPCEPGQTLPHQRLTCSGLVVASKTSSRGASRTAVMTSSRSDGIDRVTTGLLFTVMLSLLAFQLLQIVIELAHTLLPVLAIALHPVGDIFQWRRLQPAWPPLRLPPLRHQPGPSQHLEVLGDGGQFQMKRLGQLHYRRLPLRDSCQDRPPRGVRQRGKRDAQPIGRHYIFPIG